MALVGAGFLPVIAPVAVGDGGAVYNVNADTAAGSLAAALHADAYIVVTDVPAVRKIPSDPSTALDRISVEEARAMALAGAFPGGMGPKIEAAVRAVDQGRRAPSSVGWKGA